MGTIEKIVLIGIALLLFLAWFLRGSNSINLKDAELFFRGYSAGIIHERADASILKFSFTRDYSEWLFVNKYEPKTAEEMNFLFKKYVREDKEKRLGSTEDEVKVVMKGM